MRQSERLAALCRGHRARRASRCLPGVVARGSCLIAPADLAAAERAFTSALDIYSQLQQAGMLAASDMEYVDKARASLEKVRAERTAIR